MIAIRPVNDTHEIEAVAALAHEIWNEYFPPIIGQAQVDYMLDRFQSAHAIEDQIRNRGFEYFTIVVADTPVGYFALVPRGDGASFQLSKLYVEKSHRGRGLGRTIVRRVEELCANRGAASLWLTVNKDNAGSIAFYERAGFAKDGGFITDIGHGFQMDDYRMVKQIERPRSR